jgi:hypothetical protein
VPSLGAGDCPGVRVAVALMRWICPTVLIERDVDDMGVQS